MQQESFATLISPHLSTMARVAAALVGSADAEDAAQEALLRAWQAWPTLQDAGAARAWLLRITVNICHNWQRGRFGTRQRLNIPLAAFAEAQPVAAGLDSGVHAALDLRRAIAHLPPDLRQVVALRFYVGLDSPEIGAVLEIPAGTVRTRLHRALAQLREKLGDSGEHDQHGEQTATHTRGDTQDTQDAQDAQEKGVAHE